MELDNTLIISASIGLGIFFSPFLLKKFFSKSEIAHLVTSFGILGTFIGIVIGLLNFNVYDIEASVPSLLEGLRVAFFTSIGGLGAAIFTNMNLLYGIKEHDEEENIEPVEKMIKQLEVISRNQRAASEKQTNLLNGIRNALVGDGETTLLTQIQKLRTNFNDKQDDLINEFRNFAEKMTENNSKALIDALTEVMRDFNAKINEQFGENFKRLNEAVEKILVWQDNYKQQIELMIKQFQENLESLVTIERMFAELKSHSQRFSEIADDLKTIMLTMNNEKEKLQNHIHIFADLAKKAEDSLPMINNNIDILTSKFSEKVNEVTNYISEIIESQKSTLISQQDSIRISQKDFEDSLRKLVNDFNNNSNDSIRRTNEMMANQLNEFEKTLGDELTKTLTTFGTQLASLSSKFSEDYTPLTEKLHKVVNIANGLRP